MSPSAAIRAGAYDFNAKPFELNLLDLVLTRAVNHRSLRESVKKLSQAVEQIRSSNEFIGESQVIYGLPEIVGDLNAIIPVDIYNPGCPSHPSTTLHCLPAYFKIEYQRGQTGQTNSAESATRCLIRPGHRQTDCIPSSPRRD